MAFKENSDLIRDMGIGFEAEIKKWFEENIDNSYSRDKALPYCAQFGKTNYIEYLLNVGANVHYRSSVALRWASINGHIKIVKLLLNAGSDVHAYDDSALRLAIEYGHTDVVKILKDHIEKENDV
jgi:ankyrin repeat protein